METNKRLSDLTTEEEFIQFWDGATKREIRERIRTLESRGKKDKYSKMELSVLKYMIL